MSVKEQKLLKELTKEVSSLGYRVVYEKGNFQSGHCIVLDKKVVVINKFLSEKVKLIILRELIDQIARSDSMQEKEVNEPGV
ncbi:MAG: hypothetical protein J5I59_13145 [Saprospiraceae bacterium]|nr:hypothetical protein [Saprospiraceae bacterium]